jgi:predicted transcriptional regulator
MSKTETLQVKVHVEANGLDYEASGSVEEVIPQLLQFLSKAVPTYDLAKKLIFVPDLAALTDKVTDLAKMTVTGQLLLTRADIPADNAITILLFMAHLASKMGKRESDSMSIEEIATGVGKAPKTIRNVIVELLKSSLIERADRGKYRVTQKGLMQLENSLINGGAAE